MGNVSHKFPRLGWPAFRRSAAPNYGLKTAFCNRCRLCPDQRGNDTPDRTPQ